MATKCSKSRRRAGVIAYVRVSTNEQAGSGAGLQVQREQIQREVSRRDWSITELIEDAGFSGGTLRRPGIERALGMLHDGDGDALMVAKLDRLSRSMLDFAALMERSRREGWALVALDLGVDTSTAAGEAMAAVMATFAQFERRLISQRTKEALAVKKAQGVVLGRPSTMPAPIIDRIVAERAAGATLRAIALGLDADGVPTAHGAARWHHSTVRAALILRDRTLGKEAGGAS